MGTRRSTAHNASNGKEAGQTVILFVFALAALCSFTAMAIDVGLILQERRQLQNTADAAALAGAQELYDSPAAAITMAQQYAEANGIDLTDPDDTFEATTPYQADSSKIEVKVSRQVGFLFGRVLGLDLADVTARAVASTTAGTAGAGQTTYAVFILNDDCAASDQFIFSGSTTVISGLIQSNSNISISGSDNTFDGEVTYNCAYEDAGGNNTVTSGPFQVGTLPPPVSYTFSSFPCTYSWGEEVDLASIPEAWLNSDPSTNQLKPGVYCSTMGIILDGQGVTGNVTLVSSEAVILAGSDFNLTPYFNQVLAFSSANYDGAIEMSGSGGSWGGAIMAPDGGVVLSGSGNLNLDATILADRAEISGSDFSINGTIPAPTDSAGAVSLIE